MAGQIFADVGGCILLAQCTARFIRQEDQASASFFVAGAIDLDIFNEVAVAVSLFVAGAIFCEVAVMLECNFLWQAQHVVKFREIAGARNVDCTLHFSIQNCRQHQDGMGKLCKRAGAK